MTIVDKCGAQQCQGEANRFQVQELNLTRLEHLHGDTPGLSAAWKHGPNLQQTLLWDKDEPVVSLVGSGSRSAQ